MPDKPLRTDVTRCLICPQPDGTQAVFYLDDYRPENEGRTRCHPDTASTLNSREEDNNVSAQVYPGNFQRKTQTEDILDEEVELTCAADIQPQPVAWLWKDWIARGKLHILAGAPKTGKSTTGFSIAATVSSGGLWPDGTRAEKGKVFIWSGEDDANDTIIPRLAAMGANLDNVHIIQAVRREGEYQAFDPAHDMPLLSEKIAEFRHSEYKPALLLIDVIASATASDGHKNAATRRDLQPIVDLGQIHELAVFGVTHFTKGTAGRDPVERITGSLAFGALARMVWAAAKVDPEHGEGHMLLRVRSNIGPDGGGFAYDLTPTTMPGHEDIETIAVTWGKPLEGEARELLELAEQTTDSDEKSALDDAKGFLLGELAQGPVFVKRLQRECNDAGHSWSTIKRAKKALKIEARKPDFGSGWLWYLPKGTN